MPTLNVLMCAHTMLSIVENPAVSTRAVIVVNGRVGRVRFLFNFTDNRFRILSMRFQPRLMTGDQQQRRDRSIALFRNPTLLTAISRLTLKTGGEQDAVILDDGSLHDLRRSPSRGHSPNRVAHPTQATPASRSIAGYFHTHPASPQMRPPTPSADWNVVPGVGRPGSDDKLHFMIEATRRVWGLMADRHAFIVGILQGTRLHGIDRSTPQFNFCWRMW